MHVWLVLNLIKLRKSGTKFANLSATETTPSPICIRKIYKSVPVERRKVERKSSRQAFPLSHHHQKYICIYK